MHPEEGVEVTASPAVADDAGRRALVALVGVTLLSLVVRLQSLGARTFHWDEGRVGYWILRYHETGRFSYRPIIHGPFIQHVDALLFHVVPATDFWARVPVAVITAALPLSAWLLRRHLDEVELVSLGLLLTLDPLLLYYSRFMRSDALVGTFAFVAFALLVRAFDTRRPRLVYPAVVSFAFAFGSKENALVYVLCLLGAGALAYDHQLVRAATREIGAFDRLKTDLTATRSWLDDASGETPSALWLAGVFSGATLAFLAVIVLLYAPRPDIWTALDGPRQFANVVDSATVEAGNRFVEGWVETGHREHPYVAFLHDMLETLLYGSAVVLTLAVVGFVVDGYGGDGRILVAFTSYWGAVSIIGYPIATDIQAPWAAFHVVLPLTVTAAVGVAALVRLVERGVATDDRATVALAALVLTGAAAGIVVANGDYWNSAAEEDRKVLQWAQPENELKPTLAVVDAVVRKNEGRDVLFYAGDDDRFHVANESSLDQPPPGGPSWHSRLPLPWYLERAGATVTSTPAETTATEAMSDAPAVVIAAAEDRDALESRLEGYAVAEHRFKLWGEGIVVFVDRDAIREAGLEPSAL
ncbi:MAG: flippase activity-associated protein Agl23 [Halolamina sp.]